MNIKESKYNIFIKKIKKGIVAFLIVTIFSFGVFPVANAFNPFVFDIPHTGTTIAGWAEKAKEYITSTAWAIFRKQMIDYMTDELVKWIQGGGDPKFVTDWEGFLGEVADQAGGKILEDITGPEFMAGLCQPDWAIKIRIGLQKPPKFSTKARCTLSDIGVNFNDFMDNFENGGWKGWLSVSESQNNPYGMYMLVLNEKLEKEARAKLGAENEVKTASGFLSDKVCIQRSCKLGATASLGNDGSYGASYSNTQSYDTYDTRTTTKESGTWKQEDLGSNCSCEKWETRTPGKIVADGLNQSVFKDIEWLKNSEEWQNMVVAVTNAVVNRVTKEGVMAITSSDSNSQSPTPGAPGQPDVNDYKDIIPPISTASVSDPWHIKITSNEPGSRIFYTLDGTSPDTFSPNYSTPVSIISSTNLSAPTSPLKWFAMDKAFNEEEEIRTLNVSSPFSVPGLQTPSSVAVAIDATSITLLSNEPAIIYYTTDGTTPDTFSLKFIKQINLNTNDTTIIRWFAVDQDGNREATRTLSTQPLFPNNELPYIVDLVFPTPAIGAPASATNNVQFTLNPSSSRDNDRTPQISMYEWDFDNDGVYDWKTVDYDRNGVFDEEGCRTGINCGSGLPTDLSGQYNGIGNGFRGMSVSSGVAPGAVDVRYSSGQKTIILRVTDNEGLSTKTSVTINVN